MARRGREMRVDGVVMVMGMVDMLTVGGRENICLRRCQLHYSMDRHVKERTATKRQYGTNFTRIHPITRAGRRDKQHLESKVCEQRTNGRRQTEYENAEMNVIAPKLS